MTRGNGSLPGNYSARELQASGMVSAQAQCTVAEAFVLMRQRARDDGVLLADIAADVLSGRLRFDA